MQKNTCLQPISLRKERRKYVRFNNGAMQVRVKRKGLISSLTLGELVEWINYNHYGLAFASRCHFNIGDEIILDIKVENQSVSDVVAIIHNARRQAGKYRYGVQFYFGANTYMQSRDVLETLVSFEQHLK